MRIRNKKKSCKYDRFSFSSFCNSIPTYGGKKLNSGQEKTEKWTEDLVTEGEIVWTCDLVMLYELLYGLALDY